MGSRRLPDKVLMKVKGVSLLEYEIQRIKLAKEIEKIVVATTVQKEDNAIAELCQKMGVDCFRGATEDVLDRYYQCALQYPEYNAIVRITGDCPLIDPKIIDQVIHLFDEHNYDYASNVLKETFPDGMDVEIFSRDVLQETAKNAKSSLDREHVNEYILRSKKFSMGNLSAPQDFSHFRLTVDEKEDFEVMQFIIEHSDINAGYEHYISLLIEHPEIMAKNAHIMRNEGFLRPDNKT